MQTIEVDKRLDLIQMAVHVVSPDLNHNDFHEIYGLIEARCRDREAAVERCNSRTREAILQREAPEWWKRWRERWPEPHMSN